MAARSKSGLSTRRLYRLVINLVVSQRTNCSIFSRKLFTAKGTIYDEIVRAVFGAGRINSIFLTLLLLRMVERRASLRVTNEAEFCSGAGSLIP